MISLENLHVEFSSKPLFAGVSYVINDRDRIALVGKNGAGKSTMLKIIAGLQQPTGGLVAVPRETTIGYLPQVMKVSDERTVREEAELAFSHIQEMQAELDKMNRELAERTDYESEEYMALVERFTQTDERFHMMGGMNFHAELERTLMGLGFTQRDFERPTSEFSGGWRMRIELAKILLQRPDVLLLDEPTNHLDIESIQWLEQFLQNHQGAVVMVSHDRAFINNVTNRTIEISCGQIYDYKVKYDEYVTLRAERREQQLRAYENQQKEIADTKAFIERFRYQATKANQVQSRIKALEKIVPIEIDEVDNSRLRLRFTCSQRSGDFPIICEEVAKAYETLLPTSPHNGGGASSSSPSQLGGRDLGRGSDGDGAASWAEQKAQARQRKKLEKAVREAEQAVAELEQAIAILEAQMATPEGGSDMSLYEKHGRLKQQLSKAEDEWTTAMEALEGE